MKIIITESQLKSAIRNSILGYKTTYLDKFGAQFIASKVQESVDSVDMNAILGSTLSVKLQKRFTPVLNASTPYTISFNVPLRRGTIGNKLSSTTFTVVDNFGIDRDVQFDEIPQSFSGISAVSITNAGAGYTSQPTITIDGDGIGANAYATSVGVAANTYANNLINSASGANIGNVNVTYVFDSGRFTKLSGVEESFGTYNSVTGLFNFDCTNNYIFYVNPTGNFTANLQNFLLDSNNVTSVTFVLNQGATPYMSINNVLLNGANVAINWQGGTAPTGTASKKDIITLSIMNINGAKEAETLTELDDAGIEQPTSALAGLVEAINTNMAVMTQAQAQHNQDILAQQAMAHQNLVQQLTKPKQVIRDANGKIQGVA